MECILCKLEFDVKAFFYAYFHFDGHACRGTLTDILHDELFLFCDSIVVTVDHDVDKVTKPHDYSVVTFKLLFNSVEGKIVRHIVC